MQIRIDGKDGSQTLLKGVRTCSHMRLKNAVGMGDPRLPKGTTSKKASVAFPCAKVVVVTVTTDKRPDPEHIITDGTVTTLSNDGKVIGVVEADPGAAAPSVSPQATDAPATEAPAVTPKPVAKKKSGGTKKKAVAAENSG